MLKKRYAISDIHGCLKTFQKLLKTIDFRKEDELFLLGDYIDRGPRSKEVIDSIWELEKQGYTINCLKGNHEQMLLDARMNSDKRRMWLIHGGAETVESFDINYLDEIPDKYFHWLENLPYYLETEGYILVHAGLNFDIPNPFDAKHSMMWIRNWTHQINSDWLGKRIIVHGHTPTKMELIEDSILSLYKMPVIDIDAGCCFHTRPNSGFGYLCALDLDDKKLHFEKNID